MISMLALNALPGRTTISDWLPQYCGYETIPLSNAFMVEQCQTGRASPRVWTKVFIAWSVVPKCTFPASSHTQQASSITFTNAEIAEARKALSPPSKIGLNYLRPLVELNRGQYQNSFAHWLRKDGSIYDPRIQGRQVGWNAGHQSDANGG